MSMQSSRSIAPRQPRTPDRVEYSIQTSLPSPKEYTSVAMPVVEGTKVSFTDAKSGETVVLVNCPVVILSNKIAGSSGGGGGCMQR